MEGPWRHGDFVQVVTWDFIRTARGVDRHRWARCAQLTNAGGIALGTRVGIRLTPPPTHVKNLSDTRDAPPSQAAAGPQDPGPARGRGLAPPPPKLSATTPS